ncbi:unnamed protein product [Oikopleura dioica]|uniref:FUN14 domain-containing protein 1 n=1 Tax=Oikopleura dioica TaxID=34765 RepID=E4X6J2_OIKDI|nr:unnamed protein product [Oikopleura dioica]
MVRIEVMDEALGTVKEYLTGRQEVPPRTTTQILKETGAGFVGGLIIGAVIKKIGKLAFSTVGGGITCISVLTQLGYIKVDWPKVNKDYNKLKSRNPQFDLSKYPTEEIIKENVPLSCGLAGGALVSIAT